jgi:hypothetical protein
MGIDPKNLNWLAALGAPPQNNSLANLLGGLVPPPPLTPNNALSTFLGARGMPQPRNPLNSLAVRPAAVKRKVYFAFKYEDVMRVNNVRQSWKIDHPDNQLMRSFYDSSLWESKKLEGDDALKKLMREGVEYTSAVCVLIGANTWSSRWVKYEIARSVIDGRGLLAVHINSLNHHERRQPDPFGFNPLHLLGVYKSPTGKFYLYEKRQVVLNELTGQTEWQWREYADYTLAVPLPRYLTEPNVGFVQPLSTGTFEYDFVANVGHKNIGAWIDNAALSVGR